MTKHPIFKIEENSTEGVIADLEPKAYAQKIMTYPKLACKVNIYGDRIILAQNGQDFNYRIDSSSGEALQKLLLMMDGTRSLTQLQQMFSPKETETINTIIRDLDEQGLLDDLTPLEAYSGMDLLLELENLADELLGSVENNPFWKSINLIVSQVPSEVLYGFAVENYHLFSRTSYFQPTVLSLGDSTRVRQLLSELYCRGVERDKLVLKSLNVIGISHEDLADTMPLPETMAMCNGLAFWANSEPLFSLTATVLIANKTCKNYELYLAACQQQQLNSRFIEPISQLLELKLKQEENLFRRIFQEIPHIDRETRQRFNRQTYLLLEMYSNFCTAIEHYYSSAPHLLRRVSAV